VHGCPIPVAGNSRVCFSQPATPSFRDTMTVSSKRPMACHCLVAHGVLRGKIVPAEQRSRRREDQCA
jgi:hypothetical protein